MSKIPSKMQRGILSMLAAGDSIGRICQVYQITEARAWEEVDRAMKILGAKTRYQAVVKMYLWEAYLQQLDVKGGEARSERLLTMRDACRLLRVHPHTMRRWADNGMVKAYRIGARGNRRFRLDDLERLSEVKKC